MSKLALQMYTCRDFMKTSEAFEETLKKVAKIGYKNVQISKPTFFQKYLMPSPNITFISRVFYPRQWYLQEKLTNSLVRWMTFGHIILAINVWDNPTD